MDNPRERVCELIKEKTNISDEYAKDLEVGIYNFCIDYCDMKRIFKSWKINRFTMLYLEKARSIIDNLDPTSYLNNTNLLQRLNDKEFLPHDIAFMKPDMLHPDKWKDATEAYFKKYQHAYESRAEAMTDEYKCLKCKQRKGVYQEIFSRSADEPAVIHFACLECGNRWKLG